MTEPSYSQIAKRIKDFEIVHTGDKIRITHKDTTYKVQCFVMDSSGILAVDIDNWINQKGEKPYNKIYMTRDSKSEIIYAINIIDSTIGDSKQLSNLVKNQLDNHIENIIKHA